MKRQKIWFASDSKQKLCPPCLVVGVFRDSYKNTVLLPTKKAIKGGFDVDKAALTGGRHIPEYTERIVKPLTAIKEKLAEKIFTPEEAKKEVRSLQLKIRNQLQNGEIKLQYFDTPEVREGLRLEGEALREGLNDYVALGLFVGMNQSEALDLAYKQADRLVENESYYRQKNIIVRYGQVGYYTSDSKSSVVRWSAFALDLFTPVDDVATFTDLLEDAYVSIRDFTPVETLHKQAGGKPTPPKMNEAIAPQAIPKQTSYYEAYRTLWKEITGW